MNTKTTKGRNPQLLEKRDTCIAERYYYYNHFTTNTYEDILAILVQEFFLSRERIQDILVKQSSHLHKLKDMNCKMLYLKRRWPHLKWV